MRRSTLKAGYHDIDLHGKTCIKRASPSIARSSATAADYRLRIIHG